MVNETYAAVSRSTAFANKSFRPEFFRLPKSGVDTYFGLTRSFYYDGEKEGYWQLTRIRKRGRLRGITLVPFDVIDAFLRSGGQKL
jgi:hypothetical protein